METHQQESIGLFDGRYSMLNTQNFGGVNIFRPDELYEKIVYEFIKTQVFKQYPSARYTKKEEVLGIVNAMYRFYYALVDDHLSRVDQSAFRAFLVKEYELYGKVEELFKRKKLSAHDEDIWQRYASFARRGIKHLLELICLAGEQLEPPTISLSEQETSFSILFLAAEELVGLYMRSDFYRSFLDEVTLTLKKSEFVYFHVQQDELWKFDPRDAGRYYSRYVPTPNFLRNINAHNTRLQASFIAKFGVNYLTVIQCLKFLIEEVSASNDSLENHIISKQRAVELLATSFPLTPQQAQLIIDGFALSAPKMREEGRELFRPKQQYRAYKRGFFVVQDKGGESLHFSKRMALECLELLTSDVTFRKLPPEWRSNDIDTALNELSLDAGKWFENVVKDNLHKIGIDGIQSFRRMHFKDGSRTAIPGEIGEIDFLGYLADQKLLIVIEAKQVGMSTEPRMHMDDLDKFLNSQNSYANKFEMKYLWVIENQSRVADFLTEKLGYAVDVEGVGYAMITHYPAMATQKITKFTCLSITEFMRCYESTGQWNFSKVSMIGSDSDKN